MIRLLFCLPVIASAFCYAAPDPVRLPYQPTEPKFLVPVSPKGRDYQEGVERILGRRWGFGTMIYDTVGEFFAVSVWGKDYAKYDYNHPLHNFITYLRLDAAGVHPKAVKDVDVPIDLDFAMAVQRAWATMLLKSRYPTKTFLGADGWSAEFSASVNGAGAVYGYASSPQSGLTKELMDIGFALADYCKAPTANRPHQRETLIARLQAFEQKAGAAE